MEHSSSWPETTAHLHLSSSGSLPNWSHKPSSLFLEMTLGLLLSPPVAFPPLWHHDLGSDSTFSPLVPHALTGDFLSAVFSSCDFPWTDVDFYALQSAESSDRTESATCPGHKLSVSVTTRSSMPASTGPPLWTAPPSVILQWLTVRYSTWIHGDVTGVSFNTQHERLNPRWMKCSPLLCHGPLESNILQRKSVLSVLPNTLVLVTSWEQQG